MFRWVGRRLGQGMVEALELDRREEELQRRINRILTWLAVGAVPFALLLVALVGGVEPTLTGRLCGQAAVPRSVAAIQHSTWTLWRSLFTNQTPRSRDEPGPPQM